MTKNLLYFLLLSLIACVPKYPQDRVKLKFKGKPGEHKSQVTIFMGFTPGDNLNFFHHYIEVAPLLKTKQDTYRLVLAVINIEKDVSAEVLKNQIVWELTDAMKGKEYAFEPEKAAAFDPIHRFRVWDSPLVLISKEKEEFKKLNLLINQIVMKIEHASMAGEYIPDQFQPHIIVASREFLNQHKGVLSTEKSLGIREQILDALNDRIKKSSQRYQLILLTD